MPRPFRMGPGILLRLVLMVELFVASRSEFDGFQWRSLCASPMLDCPSTTKPSARSRHAVASVDDVMFLFGGEGDPADQADSLTNDLWLYTVNGHRWTEVCASCSVRPRSRRHATLSVVESAPSNSSRVFSLYLYGGGVGHRNAESLSADTILQDFWSIVVELSSDGTVRTLTNGWTQICDQENGCASGPGHRYLSSTAVIHNEIYLYGSGFSLELEHNQAQNDVWTYNPLTGEWTEVCPNIIPGVDQTLTSPCCEITDYSRRCPMPHGTYGMLPRLGTDSFIMYEHWSSTPFVFNTSTRRWTGLCATPFCENRGKPGRRIAPRVALLNGTIVLHGGAGVSELSDGDSDRLWKFPLGDDTYSSLHWNGSETSSPAQTDPRFSPLTALEFEGEEYLVFFGGQVDNTASDAFWVFSRNAPVRGTEPADGTINDPVENSNAMSDLVHGLAIAAVVWVVFIGCLGHWCWRRKKQEQLTVAEEKLETAVQMRTGVAGFISQMETSVSPMMKTTRLQKHMQVPAAYGTYIEYNKRTSRTLQSLQSTKNSSQIPVDYFSDTLPQFSPGYSTCGHGLMQDTKPLSYGTVAKVPGQTPTSPNHVPAPTTSFIQYKSRTNLTLQSVHSSKNTTGAPVDYFSENIPQFTPAYDGDTTFIRTRSIPFGRNVTEGPSQNQSRRSGITYEDGFSMSETDYHEYLDRLVQYGFKSAEALAKITEEDLANLGVTEVHRQRLFNVLRQHFRPDVTMTSQVIEDVHMRSFIPAHAHDMNHAKATLDEEKVSYEISYRSGGGTHHLLPNTLGSGSTGKVSYAPDPEFDTGTGKVSYMNTVSASVAGDKSTSTRGNGGSIYPRKVSHSHSTSRGRNIYRRERSHSYSSDCGNSDSEGSVLWLGSEP